MKWNPTPNEWQEYMDGGLTREQRVEMESRPDFHSQTQGLKEFKSACKKACLAEPVPMDRLRAGLMDATRPAKKSVAWLLLPAMAALAILAAILVMNPNRGHQTLATNDPVAAHEFIHNNTGVHAPVIEVSGAKLVGAEANGDHGCMDFTVDGSPVQLQIYGKEGCFKGLEAKEKDGMTFYEGDRLGWRCPQSYYILKGGTPEQRWKLAREICRNIGLISA